MHIKVRKKKANKSIQIKKEKRRKELIISLKNN